MKIKLIVGYRKDQEYSIDASEAHKAYYLFLNPEERAVFGNGLALVGKEIKAIEPDYNGTMGWNPNHQLDSDDWNELKEKGIDRKLRNVLQTAKQAIPMIQENPQLLSEPIQTIRRMQLEEGRGGVAELANKMSV